MPVETKRVCAINEAGQKTTVLAYTEVITTTYLSGDLYEHRSLPSWRTEDGEQLTCDGGRWLRAVRSGRRFEIDE
jgi:hypothetical protein